MFDIGALFDALDAQRRARGLSWAQAAREVGVSPSTLTGLRARRAVEGDGVLQMLLWLDRTPESFAGAFTDGTAERLQRVRPDEVLRFDAASIHAALDEQRTARSLTWAQVARDIGGVSASMLSHLAEGGRVSIPPIIRVIGWLGRPVVSFTRASKV